MIPATTATDVARRRPSGPRMCRSRSSPTTGPSVGEDVEPRQRPHEVRHEERRDDQDQEDVLPPSCAERDPVDERVGDEQREDRRDARVDERAHELLVVVADRVPVVRERPVERVAGVERAGLERLVAEEAERGDEEQHQPDDPRQEQEIRRQPLVAVEEAHSLRPACVDSMRRAPSATARCRSGC